MNNTATHTDQPDTICECGNGPFFFVPARQFPHLCLDCSDHAGRNVNGWTPENSAD